MDSVGLKRGQSIDFERFKKIFNLRDDLFKNVKLDVDEAKGQSRATKTFSLYGEIPVGGFAADAARREYEEARQEVEETTQEPQNMSKVSELYYAIVNRIHADIQYVFWLTLYTIVMILVFVERAYYYSWVPITCPVYPAKSLNVSLNFALLKVT